MTNQDSQLADHLDFCAGILSHYARCVRGIDQDMTGIGIENIFLTNIEQALKVKVLTLGQWEIYRCQGDEKE